MKTLIRSVVIALLLCLTAAPSFAHKVRIFAYVEGDSIVGETAFSGGRSAKNVAIAVYNDVDNSLISKTTTDDKGEFSFPIPAIASEQRLNLRIVVNGGDGHKNSWLLNADEYLPPADKVGSEPATTAQPAAAAATEPAATPATDQLSQQTVDEEKLRRIIDESVEKQLRPVKHMLADNREKRISLQDILGGLGYIFGLAGVAAYFSSRKKTEKGEH